MKLHFERDRRFIITILEFARLEVEREINERLNGRLNKERRTLSLAGWDCSYAKIVFTSL